MEIKMNINYKKVDYDITESPHGKGNKNIQI